MHKWLIFKKNYLSRRLDDMAKEQNLKLSQIDFRIAFSLLHQKEEFLDYKGNLILPLDDAFLSKLFGIETREINDFLDYAYRMDLIQLLDSDSLWNYILQSNVAFEPSDLRNDDDDDEEVDIKELEIESSIEKIREIAPDEEDDKDIYDANLEFTKNMDINEMMNEIDNFIDKPTNDFIKMLQSENDFVAPTYDEISDYCKNKVNVDPLRFYSYYKERNWKDEFGQYIDYKKTIDQWEKDSAYKKAIFNEELKENKPKEVKSDIFSRFSNSFKEERKDEDEQEMD